MVTMPEPFLDFGEAAETLLADDVLDSDQAGIGRIAVEDHALVQVMTQVDAEMRRFHLPAHLIGVHMEAIEIGAHRVQRVFRLDDAGCQIEQAMLERMPLADLGGCHRLAAEHHARCGRCPGGAETDGPGQPLGGLPSPA